jgi:tRNA/tmRNA/rRNA uracil-C5-methylase (TrmA/RlmC/RlmD family)
MEICKHAELCGGCVYQGIEYAQQVELKGAEISRILNEKGVNAEMYLGIEAVRYSTPTVIRWSILLETESRMVK